MCLLRGGSIAHSSTLTGIKVASPWRKSRENWSCEIDAKAAPVIPPITKVLSKSDLQSDHLGFAELVKQLCGDLIRFTFEYLGGWTGRRRLVTEHFRRRIRADL